MQPPVQAAAHTLIDNTIRLLCCKAQYITYAPNRRWAVCHEERGALGGCADVLDRIKVLCIVCGLCVSCVCNCVFGRQVVMYCATTALTTIITVSSAHHPRPVQPKAASVTRV